jgi:hypothetical protein
LRIRPKNRRWFIPIVVSGSRVPELQINANETLGDLHWLDLSDGWDVAIDVITGIFTGDLPRAAGRGWADLSRQISAYSPSPVQESLERGAIPVLGYRFEEVLFLIAQSCQHTVKTVSYDDFDLWCAAEPRSRPYQAEKNAALMRGFQMSRILVVQEQVALSAIDRLQNLLLDHMFRQIGLAVVIAEHVPEDRRHARHEFALFDDMFATTGSRESPWLLVSFDTQGAAPASDRLVLRQLWLYDWLTDHAVAMTDTFFNRHPRVAARATSGEAVVIVSPDDDIDGSIERLVAMLKRGAA